MRPPTPTESGIRDRQFTTRGFVASVLLFAALLGALFVPWAAAAVLLGTAIAAAAIVAFRRLSTGPRSAPVRRGATGPREEV
jgi:hypothetical protein